jgi:hypothetical protein
MARFEIRSGKFGRQYRTVTVSQEKVICPNASTLGYSTNVARPGDFITTDAGDNCRVLGKIIENDSRSTFNGYLLALVFGSNDSFLMERWIDPASVVSVLPPSEVIHLLRWFAQDTLPAPDLCCYAASYGTLSGYYILQIDDRLKKFREALSDE